MKPRLFREISLYRFRYIIGYGAFFITLALALFTSLETIPSGLSQAELTSATRSMNINVRSITALNIVDVPYHLLQKASITVLGLTTFAIKLPSVLIALGTGLCLVFMLRRWFKDNVAVISSLLAVTSVPFLAAGRTGTSLVMTFFWTSLLLLAATNALHTKKFQMLWKVVGLLAALSLLYSPFGVYPIIALLVSGLLHPHVRHMFRTTSRLAYVTFVAVTIAYLTPLAYAAVLHPQILATLAGIQLEKDSWQQIYNNAQQLYGLYVNPFGPAIKNGFIVPFFGAATAALMGFGLLRTIRDHHSARSYMLLIWLGFLIPLILLNPTMPYVVFIPAILLLAIGTESMIREWYDIFPFNPYARIGALVPLVILLVSIMGTNLFRYYYGHLYVPTTHYSYRSLPAIRESLERKDTNKASQYLLVKDNHAFYDLLRRDYPKLSVGTDPSKAPNKGTTIALDGIMLKGKAPFRIITSSQVENSHTATVYTKW